jgi:hypothetical protein
MTKECHISKRRSVPVRLPTANIFPVFVMSSEVDESSDLARDSSTTLGMTKKCEQLGHVL